jgi:hypothetical protein
MSNDFLPNPAPRWLRLRGAAEYLGLKPGTLSQKLFYGTGPKFHRALGSRNRIFWTPDLDEWVRNTPTRAPTPAENGRLTKLHEGAARALEKRRAKRSLKIDEGMTV